MQTSILRAGRWSLAFTGIVALAACSDDLPTNPPPSSQAPKPNKLAGDVVMVTNTLGSGAFGSLRWAVVLAANEGDIIRFDPSIAGDTILVDTTLTLPKYVTIEGPKDKGITISAFKKQATVIDALKGVTLRNVTIMGGSGGVYGTGGIHSRGPLWLENSSVIYNGAHRGVGGIYVGTEATIINSTIAYNNSFGEVAGITYPYGGKLTIVNSTINGNSYGRGLAPYFSGDYNPRVTISNSIITDNGDRLNPSAGKGNCYDTRGFTRLGVNIADDQTCGTGPSMMILGWGDVRVGVLTDDGPSRAMSLDRTSPAINAGQNCTVAVDQRYVSRDAACDIGAYEFNDWTTVTLTIDPNATISKNGGPAIVNGTVTCNKAETQGQMLRIELTQDQKVGKSTTTVQGSIDVPFTCATTPKTWSAVVLPTTGGFASGDATGTVKTINTPKWYTPSSTTSAVKVVVARR
jgi:hypothetical protein